MAYVLWSDMYSIRVPYIDSQHEKLLGIVNRCHEALKTGRSRQAVFETFNALIRYAERHFRDEEALMELARYPAPDRDLHKKAHEELVQDIFRLHNGWGARGAEDLHGLELFLNNWIIKHILLMDKLLEPFCGDLTNYRKSSKK